MEYLAELGVFGGKVALLGIGLGAILILFFGLLARTRQTKPTISVENLNDRFKNMEKALKANILDDKAIKADNEDDANKKISELDVV